MTCRLPRCTHAVVTTRDALGRTRARRVCDGICTIGERPTRLLTQTPGAPCMAAGVGDPLVLRTAHLFRVPLSLPTPADDAPVPRGVRFVPLTPTASPTPIAPLFAPERPPVRRRPDRPCDDCGALVPQGTSGPISRQCDACCPPNTLERRGQRRRDAEAAGLCGVCRAPLVQGACGRCETADLAAFGRGR